MSSLSLLTLSPRMKRGLRKSTTGVNPGLPLRGGDGLPNPGLVCLLSPSPSGRRGREKPRSEPRLLATAFSLELGSREGASGDGLSSLHPMLMLKPAVSIVRSVSRTSGSFFVSGHRSTCRGVTDPACPSIMASWSSSCVETHSLGVVVKSSAPWMLGSDTISLSELVENE